jgi:hypothetical protein
MSGGSVSGAFSFGISGMMPLKGVSCRSTDSLRPELEIDFDLQPDLPVPDNNQEYNQDQDTHKESPFCPQKEICKAQP